MDAVTKRRRGAVKRSGENAGSNSLVAARFAPGSLEADLSVIAQSAPEREWAKVPADYFAQLDHYLHDVPKKK